jgi:GTP-binding protein
MGAGRQPRANDAVPSDLAEALGLDADAIAAGNLLFEREWIFVKSVPALEFLPDADRPEIAFAGRSNVGKSSLINTLVRQTGLARTSNTPGRTQELNFFVEPRRQFYLVDMPGYGFAKAPKTTVEQWTKLVKDYLRGRPNLARVVLLIDARHGLKPVDDELMQLMNEAGVTFIVVLTKIDKLSVPARAKAVAAAEAALIKHPAAFPIVIATSSETRIGIEELRGLLASVVTSLSA